MGSLEVRWRQARFSSQHTVPYILPPPLFAPHHCLLHHTPSLLALASGAPSSLLLPGSFRSSLGRRQPSLHLFFSPIYFLSSSKSSLPHSLLHCSSLPFIPLPTSRLPLRFQTPRRSSSHTPELLHPPPRPHTPRRRHPYLNPRRPGRHAASEPRLMYILKGQNVAS